MCLTSATVATEAVSLLAQWALGPLGLAARGAEGDPDNVGSLAVARTAGFEDLGRPVDGRTVLVARPPRVVGGAPLDACMDACRLPTRP